MSGSEKMPVTTAIPTIPELRRTPILDERKVAHIADDNTPSEVFFKKARLVDLLKSEVLVPLRSNIL